MKYKILGDAITVSDGELKYLEGKYVFRNASKLYGGDFVGTLYKVRGKISYMLNRHGIPKWEVTKELAPCLIGMDGYGSDFHIVSKEDAGNIIAEWGIDPKGLIL